VVGTAEVDLGHLVLHGRPVGGVAEGLGVPEWDDGLRSRGVSPAWNESLDSNQSSVSEASSTDAADAISEAELLAALVPDLPTGIAPRGELRQFCEVLAPLVPSSPEARALRDDVFYRGWLDPNGNGLVSLAEADGWIKIQLTHALKDEGLADTLWRRFRPSFIHAFNDAKDAARPKSPAKILAGTKTATMDDYVTRSEFRVLCAYLCLYAIMFDAFSIVDKSTGDMADRRISQEELREGMELLGHYPLQALRAVADVSKEDATVEGLFAAMDADGKGMVLFSEFCAYVEAAEVDAGTAVGKILGMNEAEKVAQRHAMEALAAARAQEAKDAAERAARDADAPRRLATGVRITPAVAQAAEILAGADEAQGEGAGLEVEEAEAAAPALLCEPSARLSLTVSMEGLEWLVPNEDIGGNNVAEVFVAIAGVPDSCTPESGFDLEVAVGLDERKPLILRAGPVERFEPPPPREEAGEEDAAAPVPTEGNDAEAEAAAAAAAAMREVYSPLLDGTTRRTGVAQVARRRHYLGRAAVDALREEADLLHKFWSGRGFYRVRAERESLKVEVRRAVRDPEALRDGFRARYTAQGSVDLASLNAPLSTSASGVATLAGLEDGQEPNLFPEEPEEPEPEPVPVPVPEPAKGKGKPPPAPKGPADVAEVEADGPDPWSLFEGRVHVEVTLLAPLVPAYPEKPPPVYSAPILEIVGEGKNEKYVKDCTELYLAHAPGRTKFDTLAGFERFVNLESLWLNGNNVEALTGLDQNFRIQELRAAHCYLESLAGSSLPRLRFLRHLSLDGNALTDLQEVVSLLSGFHFLEYLDLTGNPCASGSPAYRRYVVFHCKQLKTLDLHAVTDAERRAARVEYGDSAALAATTVGFGTRFYPPQGRSKVKPGTPSATELYIVAQAAKIRAKREAEKEAAEARARAELEAEEEARRARYTGRAPMAPPPLLR